MQGVLCANFGYSQRGWPPCQECWNGGCLSDNLDREPYYYGVMEDVEGIPWNSNPKDEIRYKHLTNGVNLFMPFLGPTCHFCKDPIQAPHKFCKGQGVRDAHHKVNSERRLGEVNFHD